MPAEVIPSPGGVALSLLLTNYRAKKEACSGAGSSSGCGCGGSVSTVAGDGTVYIVNDIVTGGTGGTGGTDTDCCCKIQRQVVVTDADQLLKLAGAQCSDRTEWLEMLNRIMRRFDALEAGGATTRVSIIAMSGRAELFYDETVLTTPEARVVSQAG